MAGNNASFERQPFQEDIEFFRSKILLPSSGWTDIWQEQHSHGFIVAGATSDQLVADIYNALLKGKEEGKSYADFAAAFDEITTRHGWAYRGTPGWRSRVIYDTNMSTSFSAGRYKQIMFVKDVRPYVRYRHNSVENPRLEHLSWNGLIFRIDDQWLLVHWPPNGWGCQCEIETLTEEEAQEIWEAEGKDGPDELETEWEDRVVGSQGSNQRVVRVPVGVDPGFAYNPGRAWLEPHTVPPLTGYDAVLAERNRPWPTGFTPPPLPTSTIVPPSYILPASITPEEAAKDFLDIFGADMEKGSVFFDKAGTPVAITRKLFEDGAGSLKWLAEAGKSERLRYMNFMAGALIEPDEIWWAWEKDRSKKGDWRLRRRYLRAFEIEGTDQFAIAAFEWGKDGWTSSTTFMAQASKPKAKLKYFNNQRVGRLIYRK